MVDGSHRGFDHSKIIARLTDKHLVDISSPGSSWPSLSEKLPQHIFANGTSGLILHYIMRKLALKRKNFVSSSINVLPENRKMHEKSKRKVRKSITYTNIFF